MGRHYARLCAGLIKAIRKDLSHGLAWQLHEIARACGNSGKWLRTVLQAPSSTIARRSQEIASSATAAWFLAQPSSSAQFSLGSQGNATKQNTVFFFRPLDNTFYFNRSKCVQ